MAVLSFNIRPSQSEIFEGSTKALLLEAGPAQCIILLWNKENQRPEAIEVFTAIKDWELDWDVLMAQSHLLGYKHLQTLVTYAFDRFLPVPMALYDTTEATKQMEAMMGTIVRWHDGADLLEEEGMVVYWEAPSFLQRKFAVHFKQWQAKNMATLLIENHTKAVASLETEQEGLFLVSGPIVWIALWQNKQLLIIKAIPLSNGEAIAYEMMNACRIFNIDVQSVYWTGYGMAGADADLWQVLKKLFLHVEPASLPFTWNAEAVPHYFAHLMDHATYLP